MKSEDAIDCFVLVSTFIALIGGFLLGIQLLFVTCKSNRAVFLQHSTISSHCSQPTEFGNRTLLAVACLIAASLVGVILIAWKSPAAKNGWSWMQLITAALLPLVGIFYTRGSGTQRVRSYNCGLFLLPIGYSDIIHSVCALAFMITQAAANVAYVIDSVNSPKNTVYWAFAVTGAATLLIFLLAQVVIACTTLQFNKGIANCGPPSAACCIRPADAAQPSRRESGSRSTESGHRQRTRSDSMESGHVSAASAPANGDSSAPITRSHSSPTPEDTAVSCGQSNVEDDPPWWKDFVFDHKVDPGVAAFTVPGRTHAGSKYYAGIGEVAGDLLPVDTRGRPTYIVEGLIVRVCDEGADSPSAQLTQADLENTASQHAGESEYLALGSLPNYRDALPGPVELESYSNAYRAALHFQRNALAEEDKPRRRRIVLPLRWHRDDGLGPTPENSRGGVQLPLLEPAVYSLRIRSIADALPISRSESKQRSVCGHRLRIAPLYKFSYFMEAVAIGFVSLATWYGAFLRFNKTGNTCW